MKGPGVRVDQDVRRFWRCSLCGKVTRTAGRVTTVVCLCTGEPRWMQLEPTPRRPRYVPPPRELEPVEEYILPPDPPRAARPVAAAEASADSPGNPAFADGLDLLAAESGLVIETEFHSEPVSDGETGSTSEPPSEAAGDERRQGERRPPRGPHPARSESRERPPRPGRGGGRPAGGGEASAPPAARGDRGRGSAAPPRGPRRPDRRGSDSRRDEGGAVASNELAPSDADSLAGSLPSALPTGEAFPAGPAGDSAGVETGTGPTSRRPRRGRQRDRHPSSGAGGSSATPHAEQHSGAPRHSPPGSSSGGSSSGGSSSGRGNDFGPTAEGGAPDVPNAGGELSDGGTAPGRGRRQRRRRRGGRGPQGNAAAPPGPTSGEGSAESFGAGLD